MFAGIVNVFVYYIRSVVDRICWVINKKKTVSFLPWVILQDLLDVDIVSPTELFKLYLAGDGFSDLC